MTTTAPVDVPCPSCGDTLPVTVMTTLNAGPDSDAWRAILDGTFQRLSCPWCHAGVEVDLPLLLVDLERTRIVVGMLPREWTRSWRAVEAWMERRVAAAMREGAPPIAREATAGVTTRVVFGLDGLRDALLCVLHGLDVPRLEVSKLRVIRSLSASLVPWPDVLAVTDEEIVLRVHATEGPTAVGLPRQALSTLDVSDDALQALLADIGDTGFRSGLRWFVPGDVPLPLQLPESLDGPTRLHKRES